ncbi:MAG: 2Fe-2S iron-sulfur cluster-binding protein [Pseudomonadota bacterium]
MIEITIDGLAYQARENQTLLQVAKENAISIPHLCYHPALKPIGSCKLCGVEVVSLSGKPVIMLSCVLKVKPGLEVKTTGDRVRQAREKAFGNLLQKAPFSKRIREIAADFNVNVQPPPDGCIQCRLCVRVCNEVIKAGALRMEKVDGKSIITAEPGRCIGCGTCANLCPTRIIKVEDSDTVRTVSIQDRIIGTLPLERCEGCGQRYATAPFLHHVDLSTGRHPHVKKHHRLCRTCVKLLSDKAEAALDRL